MRRAIALALVLATSMLTATHPTAQAELASLAGTATSSTGQTLANITVQLRDLVTGQIAGTTTSTATGTFSFAGLQAGNFAVEVVNAAGQIVGASASVSVAAGAAVTGVSVSATAAVVGAAAGAAGAGAGAAAGAGGAAAGGAAGAAAGAAAAGAGAAAGATAAVVTSVAAAAGAVGAVAVTQTPVASPSR